MKPPQELIRQLPDLNALGERLEGEPEMVLARAFPPEDRRLPPPIPAPPAALTGEVELLEPVGPRESTREDVLRAGARAVGKIRDQGGDADLDPEEMFGLEAIVHIEGRPAILVQEGHFLPPPVTWQALEQARDAIENTLKSVGRIEVDGHPSYEWVGTGFLVAEDVIMTNRHVANVFCRSTGMGLCRHWAFEPGMTARVDYVEELGAETPAEFALTDVIGVHDTFDLALFRAERTSSQGLASPDPLVIASEAPASDQGHQVYVVGYPAWDGRRNDPVPMQRIFSNIFNVKRLQPGEIMQVLSAQGLLRHDCSTLGGNSGSCVVDLESHRVIGLHFGGRYLQGNSAVALWQLTGDGLLRKAKLNFS